MIPLNMSYMSLDHSPALQKYYAAEQAKRVFAREHRKSWICRIIELLTGRSSRVLNLYCVKQEHPIRNRHYEGIRTVPLKRIRGSENRNADFDIHFHPTRQHTKLRWVAVAAAMLGERALPPVDLIRLGDTYFVRDGHHRVSAARAFGQREIDANVTTWTIDENFA
jgi:hypothetical protein